MHIDSNALDMLSECVIIVNDMPVHRHKHCGDCDFVVGPLDEIIYELTVSSNNKETS